MADLLRMLFWPRDIGNLLHVMWLLLVYLTATMLALAAATTALVHLSLMIWP